MNDIAALEDVTLVDLIDSEFEIGGVHCRLIHQRDGVWVLVLDAENRDLGILHRKPNGSWELTDDDGSRMRQGPDWKALIEHQVLGT